MLKALQIPTPVPFLPRWIDLSPVERVIRNWISKVIDLVADDSKAVEHIGLTFVSP
jgi:hypothetical protein